MFGILIIRRESERKLFYYGEIWIEVVGGQREYLSERIFNLISRVGTLWRGR
jgi:hypothetical protein